MEQLFTEENIITTLGVGGILAGLAGAWIASIIFIERDKVENAINCKKAMQSANNYARKQAQMATAANTIRKGHE